MATLWDLRGIFVLDVVQTYGPIRLGAGLSNAERAWSLGTMTSPDDGIWCLNNCLGIIALIDAAGGCTYLDMSWHKIQTWPCLDIVFDIIFDSSVGQCAYSASIIFCLGPPLPQHDGDQGGQRRHQRAHCKPAARFWARRRSIPSSPWQRA